MNRIKPLIKGLTILITIGSLGAQDTPLSEIFFLDLGIVIEPANGSEAYSRLIKKPSEEISFKIKKVESGSVYMASSKELLTTLGRINNRIERLENSFQSEMNALKKENVSLRQTLAVIQSPAKQSPILTNKFIADPLPETASAVVSSEPKNIIPSKPAPSFNHSVYMSGVFAYQREDYQAALDKFSGLSLNATSKKISENILYWMADALQQTGQYKKALSLLNTITSTGKLRIDDALVQKGLLHRKMGNEDLALAAFGDVVSQYPKSEYLRLAQMELKKSNELK
ncbi:MAG: tetratricopeptide repeat protein [Candidatus Marinimicrobia bacterium]|jgi:TolA-binding protein|nr:tetratricopeptide repeat protein [Candidatus Neomarinimicrobiota bacterium]MBT3676803.1 tetratricopeptide repeat protein [Candidatus Neomarinimicrobiota bacterium]MBT3763781.1 tetratricopeptide repeat protein [Candidatus Neomarinimicrobiota bacterium]MBT4069510.1 tetratricopeptide repeat protein [Candidatus Neomarinimicrobiota bacterium]MBT4269932.1 tetratricopeptide repeat protein [Candidatus Neomarinimicrobiota bacterium]